MQTNLSAEFRNTPEGREAEAILRKCVHCGFCTATCPTYQILGDELDGPRGRIYLIKEVLEGAAPTRRTQLHLDRCLTCRNCETTCPSGVEYGQLLDIGRRIVEEKVPRGSAAKALRWSLKEGLSSPMFGPAMKLGQGLRSMLPQMLKAKVPAAQASGRWPTREHARKVLMLAGCVQPSMMPNINSATARVLDAAGIQTAGAAGGGLLRRREIPSERPARRAGSDARQHRCLVAGGGRRPGRGDRDERIGLRRHRQGIRPSPAA